MVFYGGLELKSVDKESKERIIYHCYNCSLSYSENLKISISEEKSEYPYEYVEQLVDELANRVIATLKKEEINELANNNKYSHFGIGLWIRNNFIHLNSNIKYRMEADTLSHKVFNKVIEKIADNPNIKKSGTIVFYNRNAEILKIEDINANNLKHISGMMTRIYLKNGNTIEGFGNPEDKEGKYIYLWKWDNLNEDTGELIGDKNNKYNQTFEKVLFKDIDSVETITYSNPRRGCKLIFEKLLLYYNKLQR